MSLTLDQKTHTYRLDGVQIPGVTRVLSENGISDFSKVNPQVLDRASAFGEKLHLACCYYDQGVLNTEKLDKNLKPYVRGWIKFRKDFGFDPEHIEYSNFHPKYKYAFTLDRAGMIKSGRYVGRMAVVEIKSCDLYPSVPIQLSAYQEGFNAISGNGKITLRIAVRLLEGDYKYEVYKNKADWSVFLSCLTVSNWRKLNGKSNN